MVWEIAVVTLFAALTVGRIAWEKRPGQLPRVRSRREEADWYTAIK